MRKLLKPDSLKRLPDQFISINVKMVKLINEKFNLNRFDCMNGKRENCFDVLISIVIMIE